MTQLPKPSALDLLVAQIDADLDALFAALRRDIDAALADPKVNLPLLERRINGRLGALFGFAPEDWSTSALGVYTQAALTAARTLGAGQTLTLGAERDIHGETTGARLRRAAVNLRAMLLANLTAFRDRPGATRPQARTFFRTFLTVGGAENATGVTADHGLYEVRRTLVTEARREHGVGVKYGALLAGEGIAWRLDPRHPVRDICDTLAGQDLHGLGRGIYPADAVPPYPPHPFCLCHLVRVPLAA